MGGKSDIDNVFSVWNISCQFTLTKNTDKKPLAAEVHIQQEL